MDGEAHVPLDLNCVVPESIHSTPSQKRFCCLKPPSLPSNPTPGHFSLALAV